MITKSRLITAIATEIADVTECDNDRALLAAQGAFRATALHVLLPLLDAYDYEARPMYREQVSNAVRDLIASEVKVEDPDAEAPLIEVRDE